MLKRQDYFLLGAAFLSFLFTVSLWFGVGDAPMSAMLAGSMTHCRSLRR